MLELESGHSRQISLADQASLACAFFCSSSHPLTVQALSGIGSCIEFAAKTGSRYPFVHPRKIKISFRNAAAAREYALVVSQWFAENFDWTNWEWRGRIGPSPISAFFSRSSESSFESDSRRHLSSGDQCRSTPGKSARRHHCCYWDYCDGTVSHDIGGSGVDGDGGGKGGH